MACPEDRGQAGIDKLNRFANALDLYNDAWRRTETQNLQARSDEILQKLSVQTLQDLLSPAQNPAVSSGKFQENLVTLLFV